MSCKTSPHPEPFTFTKENEQKAQDYINRYPKGREVSAIIPILRLAQNQSGGWLPQAAIEFVAHYLSLPSIKVYEIATFYTMFNLKPVGKHLIQICRTTPCWLRGAVDLTKTCEAHLNVSKGDVTNDALFSYKEVECLGACANAPMVQINDDYYEDLTPDALIEIIEELKKGNTPPPGSSMGRQGSSPQEDPRLSKPTKPKKPRKSKESQPDVGQQR